MCREILLVKIINHVLVWFVDGMDAPINQIMNLFETAVLCWNVFGRSIHLIAQKDRPILMQALDPMNTSDF